MKQKNELVLILDFGGQYNQLIARRVRECGVYCEVKPYTAPLAALRAMQPKAIIFTGGPNSVYDPASPHIGAEIFSWGVPVLGICYGCQLMAYTLGGTVESARDREYGKTEITYGESPLFDQMDRANICWMSHTDYVAKLPAGFENLACTKTCPNAAFGDLARRLYAVQFHPEVLHTRQGTQILKNFLFRIAGCAGDWAMSTYADTAVAALREKIGDKKVLLALSGGVDSSVAAALISRAVGDRLTCIFVDHGLMRKNEGDEVEAAFSKFDFNLIRVNAANLYFEKLRGVTEPEQKRKIIGELFIRVFEREAKKIGKVHFLAQGTIYPDVIESGAGDAAVIKSHHNVGGLPDYVDFEEIIEPLRMLFKDEVRALGRALGLPDSLVERQPFPGPGLAVRIIGAITPEKAALLQEADRIFREEIAAAGLAGQISQYFAVLTDMRSVGVMGDARTYDYTVALRGVVTDDFMTAEWARIPYDVLERASSRIVNEVGHVNRVVYDVTSKPPATVEWE